ncbi:MAG: branched-chain-amino-acid transaminase [Spirochaetota bacterium]
MASAFTLAVYPWVYIAQYKDNGTWSETYTEKPHKSPAEEAVMDETERAELLARRNSFPELPLVNYTSQYGLGCFEGLKAFPQPDGGLKMFRPDENGKRMARSMEGLKMPPFPPEKFVEAISEVVAKNAALGFRPEYDPEWEKDGFMRAKAVYIRPFTWAESGIGVNLSSYPYVVAVTTPVGSYFDPDASTAAVTTRRVRANPGGTGWIKCDANYVMSALVKKEAQAAGYMESIFLDANEHTYLEEGSSSNIFVRLKDGTLVTPDLRDTVLPGINRASVITLAREWGVPVEERQISVDEVLSDGAECFVSGTAAGVTQVESVTHEGKTAVFNDGKIGDLTRKLRDTLKGIQYGAVEDTHGWMYTVPVAEARKA